MSKKIAVILAAAFLCAAAAPVVSAQAVVMNSAETINKGNFKLALFPTTVFGKNGEKALWGVAGRFGYGIAKSLDVEAEAAIFNGLRYFGIAGEYWFIRGRNFNLSAAVGGHMTNRTSGGNSAGLDTSFLASTRPWKNLEIYGGFMLALDWVRNPSDTVTRLHFVPGIEYRLRSNLDLLAEFGVGLGRNSRHYASVGLAFYFR
jgi:hypothetical protein